MSTTVDVKNDENDGVYKPQLDRKETDIMHMTEDKAKAIHEEAEMMNYYATRKAVIYSIIILVIWLFGGAFFYSKYYGWPYLTALYYAAQAGLSIGFGALAETTDASRAYTIFHVMAGSSFIVGALGLFVSQVMERNTTNWDEQLEEVQKRASQGKDVSNMYHVQQKLTFWQENRSAIMSVIVFLLWGMVGVCYGYFYEDWSVITSIYFAVTACSTAGLQAPSVDLEENTFRMFYVTLFVVVGVPAYGMILGQFANLFIDDYLAWKTSHRINKFMKKSEIEFAMHFDGSNTDVIQWEDFLQFSLIRLGATDMSVINDIRTRFDNLDVDKSGFLDKSEMYAEMQFGRYDVGEDGLLGEAEFFLLYGDLQTTEHNDTVVLDDPVYTNKAVMAAIYEDTATVKGEDGTVRMSRADFVAFWKFVTSKSFSRDWFKQHAHDYLHRDKYTQEKDFIRLPLAEFKSDDAKSAEHKVGNVTVTHKRTEIAHFYEWSRTEAGKKFLEENPDWASEGIPLPEEAYHVFSTPTEKVYVQATPV